MQAEEAVGDKCWVAVEIAGPEVRRTDLYGGSGRLEADGRTDWVIEMGVGRMGWACCWDRARTHRRNSCLEATDHDESRSVRSMQRRRRAVKLSPGDNET